mmetsp:Transcript_14329/g.31113  ORF Transcript_14329/g.31113 Transcript_14329/m.31113 type:complete len:257 (+) Transcript_14329:716-1486(+)
MSSASPVATPPSPASSPSVAKSSTNCSRSATNFSGVSLLRIPRAFLYVASSSPVSLPSGTHRVADCSSGLISMTLPSLSRSGSSFLLPRFFLDDLARLAAASSAAFAASSSVAFRSTSASTLKPAGGARNCSRRESMKSIVYLIGGPSFLGTGPALSRDADVARFPLPRARLVSHGPDLSFFPAPGCAGGRPCVAGAWAALPAHDPASLRLSGTDSERTSMVGGVSVAGASSDTDRSGGAWAAGKEAASSGILLGA